MMNLKNSLAVMLMSLLLISAQTGWAQPFPAGGPGGPPGGPGGPGGPGAGGPPAGFAPGSPLRIERDLEFARAANKALYLDLYLRDTADKKPLPVVIWLHGGNGDKSPTPAARLVSNGYAVASVNYRDAAEAVFPEQLYDVKAAVRWLRANAKKYNLDEAHIGVWGPSAGGYLSGMLGTTGDVKALEGNEGNPEYSSRVQAVADFYGYVDVLRMDATASKPKPASPPPPEAVVIGGPVLQNLDKAKAASALTYVSADDPPFLLVHGTADKTIPARQSEFFQIALKHAGVENTLEYVPGAGHNIREVQTPAVADMVTNFFDKHLRNNQHLRDDPSTISETADSWIDPFSDDLPGTQYKLYATPARGMVNGKIPQASYRVYLPPGYDAAENATKRYPVIYNLHGLNDDSRKAIYSGYVSRADVAIRTGLMPAAIIIVVQGLNRHWYVDSPDGKYPVESVILKDLIPHVDKTYRTVTTREGRAIEGHSMGGAGALHLGFKYPDLFGSVAAIAPALIDKSGFTSGMNLEMLKMMFGGDIAKYEAEGGWTLAEKNADKIRGRTFVRLICGDKDGLLARAKFMSEILTRAKIEHQLIESKDAPHSVKEVLARLDENPFEYYGKVFAKFK